MEGGIFPGMEFVREGCPGEVCSSVLSYQICHVTPGRWLRGNFFRGREFVLVGLPVKMGSLYVNSKLLKCYYMLHLDIGRGGIFVRQFELTKILLHVTLGSWWRGGFIRWVSPGRACSFLTSEFNDMLIH